MFEQTCPRWRLLIVIEPEDAQKFAELLASELSDVRVHLIFNQGKKLAGAINTGMRAACTPFVAILLGDDTWDPCAIAVLESNIERFPQCDFFHSARRVIDENDEPISAIYPARESFALTDFWNGSPVKHLLCWRRELGLTAGGVDETLNSVGPDDYDFPWVMAEHGARFHAIQECLYIYRDHREGYRLTTHLPRDHHAREIETILRKHGVPTRARARLVRQAKTSYLRQCLYLSSRDQTEKESLGFDPRNGWRESYSTTKRTETGWSLWKHWILGWISGSNQKSAR